VVLAAMLQQDRAKCAAACHVLMDLVDNPSLTPEQAIKIHNLLIRMRCLSRCSNLLCPTSEDNQAKQDAGTFLVLEEQAACLWCNM